jgi:aspartate carbamoyltransferase catalytic subunit
VPNPLFGKSIIWSQDFHPDILEDLFARTYRYTHQRSNSMLHNKRFVMLFYEPSTRTRFSFEAAIDDLGGSRISTESAMHFSSATKGETLEDTIRVMSAYGDCIVLRHPEEDAAMRARDFLQSQDIWTPIINAGCGKGQHPTQSLIDLYTLYKAFGRMKDLTIAVVGDLKHGRTVRSLAYLLGKFRGNKIHFVSPVELSVGYDILAYLNRHETPFTQSTSLDPYIEEVDAVYMTRTQEERFENKDDSKRLKGSYRLTTALAERMRRDALIMHPLPKVGEIDEEVYRLPQAAFYQQSDNGVLVRKALLEMMFSPN